MPAGLGPMGAPMSLGSEAIDPIPTGMSRLRAPIERVPAGMSRMRAPIDRASAGRGNIGAALEGTTPDGEHLCVMPRWGHAPAANKGQTILDPAQAEEIGFTFDAGADAAQAADAATE